MYRKENLFLLILFNISCSSNVDKKPRQSEHSLDSGPLISTLDVTEKTINKLHEMKMLSVLNQITFFLPIQQKIPSTLKKCIKWISQIAANLLSTKLKNESKNKICNERDSSQIVYRRGESSQIVSGEGIILEFIEGEGSS